MKVLKWLLIGVGAAMALILLMAIIGLMVPKGHTLSRSATYDQPPEVVWAAITDYAGQSEWRPDLVRAEQLPDRGGHPMWREVVNTGPPMTFETVEAIAPRRLVRRIADPDLPFSGSWIYELEPSDGGSRLTITENGEVKSPIWRFMSMFFDLGKTAENYLHALGHKFGEDVTVEEEV